MDSRFVIGVVVALAVGLLIIGGVLFLGNGDDVPEYTLEPIEEGATPTGESIYAEQTYIDMYDGCMSVATRRLMENQNITSLSAEANVKLGSYCKCATDKAKVQLTESDLAAFARDQTSEPTATTLKEISADCAAEWLK